MARGPDGQGGGAGYSLADQLFNRGTLGVLAQEYSVLPGFAPDRFVETALPRFAGLGVHARLEVIAEALAEQLASDFPEMADQVEAALPPPLDPSLRDDDFGRFIHAVPGVLAMRHGMDHPERALDLLHAATQRFSMEYAIRPFLNRWPDQVLARLDAWVEDPHYHVRRLVSEGTRPKLPWGMGISLDPLLPLRFLDALHGDETRFVTRSVANHLNDLSKIAPDAVLGRLEDWQAGARQDAKELDWMTRHALRTAVKRGEPRALALLGYRADLPVRAQLSLDPPSLPIGETLEIVAEIEAPEGGAVMVDYRLRFHRPKGSAEKVFKLRSVRLKPGQRLRLVKRHRMKGDATTFRLHPGPHAVILQVNGRDVAEAAFDLREA
ncbi:hypothetical protein [Salipiger sp. PrR002]|uniref:hypothetical protein n=1 Tax=Salipiger sp. PrR002 TaxID=2706489 RepID=UPI0013B81ABC|nr:hypothetical protein [Salipiger sp. PrR002]NDW00601.1 hypothetical protein [Salipiger sp. PrR002]NDW57570.1 hypothetical protein [Salipiger sp. PrR004]